MHCEGSGQGEGVFLKPVLQRYKQALRYGGDLLDAKCKCKEQHKVAVESDGVGKISGKFKLEERRHTADKGTEKKIVEAADRT